MVAAARIHRTSPTPDDRPLRADSIATRERLLASSLRLFSERGYEGTSVRAITDDAGVNLAAANYHFGSKQKLLQATFQAALAPINAERVRLLEVLEASSEPVELADLVRTFVEPLFSFNRHNRLPKLLANLFAESKEVAVPLLQSTFRPTVERFTQAFEQALPDIDPNDLQWRMHFMVGSMLQLANFDAPLFAAAASKRAGPSKQQVEVGLQQLIDFTVAGLRQDAVATTRGGK